MLADENFVKLRRRIARAKDYEDFDTYLSAIFNRTSLDRDQYDRLKALHEEQSEHFKFIEPFTVRSRLFHRNVFASYFLDRTRHFMPDYLFSGFTGSSAGTIGDAHLFGQNFVFEGRRNQ